MGLPAGKKGVASEMQETMIKAIGTDNQIRILVILLVLINVVNLDS